MDGTNPKFLNRDGSVNTTAAMAEGRRIRAKTARLMFGSKATEITTGRKGGWGSILFARLSDMR